MKVTVKSIPVRYNGKTYQGGESVDIKQEHFDANLFKEAKSGKTGAKSKEKDE